MKITSDSSSIILLRTDAPDMKPKSSKIGEAEKERFKNEKLKF